MPGEQTIQIGLSPLARGTHNMIMDERPTFRFIPAGAGNTWRVTYPAISCRVYPRWRGEHVTVGVTLNCWNGLSPLARGTPKARYQSIMASRFIPAGAGNTYPNGTVLPDMPVYPRWRGEHAQLQKLHIQAAGLSPLARGTHQNARIGPVRWRFIPAGAGNTESIIASGYLVTVYPRWRGEHSVLPVTFVRAAGLSPLARGTRFFYPPQQ